MRVLYFNNYPMDEAARRWRAGDYPGNHLFGTNLLGPHGMEVRIPPYRVHRSLARLGRWLRLGDLDQQFRALLEECDVIYCAAQADTLALAILRTMGIFRTPLVGTVHAPFAPGLERLAARGPYRRGHDQLVCMGPEVERHLREEIGIPASRLHVIPWGVDLDFYRPEYQIPPPDGLPVVLSAGKAARDLDTLIRSAEGLPCRFRIATTGNLARDLGNLPANVELLAGPGDNFALSYPELLAAYQAAHVVAVPLQPRRFPRGQTGNTSVLEAMAMSRPVLMSRTSLLALDLEQEGVGEWVDAGDVEGWRRAILRMLEDPERASRMGRRGRQLCEERFNMREFSTRLAGVLRLATGTGDMAGSSMSRA